MTKRAVSLWVTEHVGGAAPGAKFYSESAIKGKLADLQSETKEKELKKVWVCGPPGFNETFQRYFEREHRGDARFEII